MLDQLQLVLQQALQVAAQQVCEAMRKLASRQQQQVCEAMVCSPLMPKLASRQQQQVCEAMPKLASRHFLGGRPPLTWSGVPREAWWVCCRCAALRWWPSGQQCEFLACHLQAQHS